MGRLVRVHPNCASGNQPHPRVLHCLHSTVGVAGETSAIIPDTTVAHLADSFQGLPDAHAIVSKVLIYKDKVHAGLGSSSLVAHVLHYPPPPHANSFIIGTAVINTHTESGLSLCRLTTLLSSYPLRSSVDTGAGDRGGATAEFAVVVQTLGCREGVGLSEVDP
jgi:hypothetical protein